jgi:Arc/MetJ-type ribon-helix-helix transcriptional regulator
MSRYDESMTVKITVSLPDHLVEEARQAVADGRARSVSAYVASAMAARTPGKPLLELLDEWDAELGRPSDEDFAWARKALGLPDGP